MPLMDALNTKRTERYRLGSVLTGNNRRGADVIAAADLIIARAGLTEINTATFGDLVKNSFDNGVSIANAGTTLTSPNNPWTSDDVGKVIHVAGAGTSGGTLSTTIAGFNSAGSISLTDAASTQVVASSSSAAGLAIWGSLHAINTPTDIDLSSDGLTEERAASLDLSNTDLVVKSLTTNGALNAHARRHAFTANSDVVALAVTDGLVELDNSSDYTNCGFTLPASSTNGHIIIVHVTNPGAVHGISFAIGTTFSYDNVALSGADGEYPVAIAYQYSTFSGWMIVWISRQGNDVRAFEQSNGDAHAGGGQASATAIPATVPFYIINNVASANDSVKLPAWSRGKFVYVFNAGSNAAQIYGKSTDRINDIAAATGISLPAGKGAIFHATLSGGGGTYGIWYAIGLTTDYTDALALKAPIASPTFTGTATMPRAILTPNVLTDGATIAINAALGNLHRVTLTADAHGFGVPTNPVDGQILTLEIIQGGAGSYTVTWDAIYDWTTSVAAPTLSTAVAKHDFVTFRYIGALTKWRAIAVNLDD